MITGIQPGVVNVIRRKQLVRRSRVRVSTLHQGIPPGHVGQLTKDLTALHFMTGL